MKIKIFNFLLCTIILYNFWIPSVTADTAVSADILNHQPPTKEDCQYLLQLCGQHKHFLRNILSRIPILGKLCPKAGDHHGILYNILKYIPFVGHLLPGYHSKPNHGPLYNFFHRHSKVGNHEIEVHEGFLGKLLGHIPIIGNLFKRFKHLLYRIPILGKVIQIPRYFLNVLHKVPIIGKLIPGHYHNPGGHHLLPGKHFRLIGTLVFLAPLILLPVFVIILIPIGIVILPFSFIGGKLFRGIFKGLKFPHIREILWKLHPFKVLKKIARHILMLPFHLIDFLLHFPSRIACFIKNSLVHLIRLPFDIVRHILRPIKHLLGGLLRIPLLPFKALFKLPIIGLIPVFLGPIFKFGKVIISHIIWRNIKKIVLLPVRTLLFPLRIIKWVLLLPVRILALPFLIIDLIGRLIHGIISLPIKIVMAPIKVIVFVLECFLNGKICFNVWKILKTIVLPIRIPFNVVRYFGKILLVPHKFIKFLFF